MRDFDNDSEIGDREATTPNGMEQDAERPLVAIDPPKFDMLAKGVVVGLTVSVITHAGKQVVGTLMKNPVVVFGLGFAVGFLARRHRKKIIAVAGKAGEQGKAFALRQQENLKDLLFAEDKEATED